MRTKTKQLWLLALIPGLVLGLMFARFSQTKLKEDVEPQWEELADGSHLLLSSYDEVNREDIERCFDSEAGVECLRGVMWHREMINLDRDNRPLLTSVVSGEASEHSMEGYHCKIFVGGSAGDFIRESIWSTRGELRVNTVQVPNRFNGTPLSKEEVESYFEANSIDPKNPWLNCYGVAQLVVAGSFASLTSSDLTLETFTKD